MPCTEELLTIAQRLARQRYFHGWDMNVLQAFVRDEGRCVYCGQDLFRDFSVVAAGDHLLPRSKYPDLANVVQNRVASCGDCNQLKRNYDPCNGELPADLEEARPHLIEMATAEISRRRAEGNWRAEFERATGHFRQAVQEYRECLRKE